MKRNKIISVLEGSIKNKMLISFLAISLVGVGGMTALSNTNSPNNLAVNKTVLAQADNSSSNEVLAHITNVSTSVNLRAKASTSSKVLTSLKNNTSVIVLGKQGDWYKVNANGTVGYIYQNYISTSDKNSDTINNSSSKTSAHIINVSTTVNLRAKASTSSKVLTRLKNNTNVTILNKQGDWYKVDVNGTVGYIYGTYVSTSSKNSDVTIENSTSNSTLFNDNYQKLYYSIEKGLNITCIPGPELVTNLDNYVTINGENYYYVYTPVTNIFNMANVTMDSSNGNFSQIGNGQYVNAEGKALPKSDYSLIATAKHSENVNSLSSSEMKTQLSRIANQYLNNYVAQDNGSGSYANMNNNIQNLTINLNNYKVFNGEKAYSVVVNSKDNTQLYVSLNGFIYISTENGFANVSNAPHMTQEQWQEFQNSYNK